MHDRLFATHGQEWGGSPSRDREVMITFAHELELDVRAFERCLDDPAVTAAVQRESQQALELGINATPFFLINGALLPGARPFQFFKQIITQLQAEQ